MMTEKVRKIPQIVILGLEGSGKSTVLNRLMFGTIADGQPEQSTCFINVKYGLIMDVSS